MAKDSEIHLAGLFVVFHSGPGRYCGPIRQSLRNSEVGYGRLGKQIAQKNYGIIW